MKLNYLIREKKGLELGFNAHYAMQVPEIDLRRKRINK